MPELTDAEIRSRIVDAFKPRECRVEPLRYGGGVKFAVFDSGRMLIEIPKVMYNDVRRVRNLNTVIEKAKNMIQKRTGRRS